MKPCVVDASVVAAALFQEVHAEAARSLLVSNRPLLAPDLMVAEVAKVIWKRSRRGEIDAAEAQELLADVLRLPLRLTASTELVETALELAVRTGRTVYDCMYLALALRNKAVLVTGDRRLANALVGSPLAAYISYMGNMA